MKKNIRLVRKITPWQLLVIGYLLLVWLFAFLLTLPIATTQEKSQPLIDALFLATSGISTSGLSVVDVGSYYSLFGQIILLIDFQIGGLGYMTFIAFAAFILQRRLSFNSMQVAVESLAGPTLGDLKKYFLKVILFTLIFEGFCTLILTIYWMPEHSFFKSLYLGVFHSVSTFCTAGFALFPSSLIPYQKDLGFNLVINVVSLAGGIGFFVLNDLHIYFKNWLSKTHPRRLSVHSKLALTVTGFVLLGGSAIILMAEAWPAKMGLGDRILISTFQAISASTTDGFNSVDIAVMQPASLFALIVLMLIGASPGSTGGGMKTTTLGLLGATLWAALKNEQDINLFQRRASWNDIRKALAVFLFFLAILLLDIFVMTMTEKGSFLAIIFEITSALGNTGLSMGITPVLTTTAKILLTITMFIGRVGPLTIGFAFIGRKQAARLRYAEDDLFIG